MTVASGGDINVK